MKRKFFSCIVCKPGEKWCSWIFDIIVKECAFVFNKLASQYDWYFEIEQGDIIFLNYNKVLVAYGEAVNTIDRLDEDEGE